ncbi:MAG: hypothetical protein KF914_13130 [Rhizobiaceae bacterium]|nr:hypothetical protein [Rhizobiaceae bacterium]
MTVLFRNLTIEGSLVYRFPLHTRDQPTVVRHNTDAAARQYETGVLARLVAMGGRATGQVVLGALSRVSRPIFLVPSSSDENAGAIPVNVQASRPAGAPVYSNDRGDRFLQNGRPVIGTGGGSPVVVLFNPHDLQVGDRRHRRTVVGGSAEEVLLHELVHAYRMGCGTMTSAPGPRFGGEVFGNDDEFLAILVANIFSSESGSTALRGSHGGGMWRGALGAAVSLMMDAALPFGADARTLSQRFAEEYRNRLVPLRTSEAALFAGLARINAHFNPVRDLAAPR